MDVGYFTPTDLGEALSLLKAHDPVILAGGTDYYPALQTTSPKRSILDITALPELHGLHQLENGDWRIGAAITWTDLLDAALPSAFDGLKAAAREVGSVQIQNVGTMVGNICNASPAADGIPPLLTLDARVEVTGPDGVRQWPLDQFMTGVRQTILQPDELVTAIIIPPLPDRLQGAFEKLGARRYLVISITMTAVIIGCDDAGRIDFARIAVGACSPVATRLPELEQYLIGQAPESIAFETSMLNRLSPINDVRGDAVYRMEAVTEQIARAVRTAYHV